ncbi:MAG: nitroreductase family deazaflavin-dependent oxidoreductase [Thermoleophilaceae bacterium]|nr:nitroreductase family deazaflavin-dependent oxidoreductase [Thermoleophilaceae bacterium]
MSGIPQVDPTAKPTRVQAVGRAFVKTKAGTWMARTFAARVDPWLLKVSKGRVATGVGFPSINLTTIGRKSGEPRTTTLLYFTQGDDVVLIASSFGRDKHPAWYLNLAANPEAELLCGGYSGKFTARQTEGEERDRLFALADQLYSGYTRYAENTTRKIPVMVLSPVAK